jgi:hypothetical protein
VETTKANGGAIVGWVFAGLGTVLAVAAIALLFQFVSIFSDL